MKNNKWMYTILLYFHKKKRVQFYVPNGIVKGLEHLILNSHNAIKNKSSIICGNIFMLMAQHFDSLRNLVFSVRLFPRIVRRIYLPGAYLMIPNINIKKKQYIFMVNILKIT